jgi:putative Mg2+ transporter-C (MgtC) family protein
MIANVTPGWDAIALRLGLTVIAGLLIGLYRRQRGHAAGLRTTLLVALAAALAMLQADLMMPWRGKTSDSFVVLDLMRLPLGILSGVGFIGAGAILRRGRMIVGLTTAASLWFVTVLGLCFGGGQIALGLVGLLLALAALHLLKRVESAMREDRSARMSLTVTPEGPTEQDLRSRLTGAGLQITQWAVLHDVKENERTVECTVAWRGYAADVFPPPIWDDLSRAPGLRRLRWKASLDDG